MTEKKNISSFRNVKIVQLIFLLVIEALFLTILFGNPSHSRYLFEETPLFILCAGTWILMLFSLICILIDLFMLRSFAKESHALNRIAYLDTLTGIPNRHGLDIIFQTYDTPESMENVGCYMASISSLKELNEEHGRSIGDTLIRDFCTILEKVGDRFGIVGRNGGNEFLAVINDCTPAILKEFTDNLEQELTSYNEEHPLTPIRLKSTYVLNASEHISAFPQLLIVTYNRLHAL